MKNGKLQCKDIPTARILSFLNANPTTWHNWYLGGEFDVRHAMPNGFNLPENLVLAKMRNLIDKGLVDGCACGCRGDFHILPKGQQLAGL